MSISQNGVKLLVSPIKGRVLFLFVLAAEFLLSALFVVSLGAHIIFPEHARAAAGASSMLSYQGRLTDSSGNALGGSGTNYCFRFSIYDDATVGAPDNKLWPSGTPSTMTVSVANGVFNVGIGDTVAGGDDLSTYNFAATSSVYLNIETENNISGSCAGVTFGSEDNLSPRQRLDSVAYARAAYELYGGNARIGTGSGVTTGNQKYLHLDQVTNSETIGGACPTNSVNGSVWYNSNHSRALICELNIIKVLKTIGNGTTTVDAVAITGNTEGTPVTVTSGAVSFAGGNNITLSQAGNAITIRGVGGGIGALAAGTQTATSGTINFANSNNISFGMSGSNQITASAAFGGVAGSAASTVTNGVVQFSNLNGISFGLNGSTMSASYIPRPMIAASNTTYSTGTVVFTGGNNVTVTYNGQTVSISAFNQSVQTQNLHNVTLSGNTQGVMAQISSGTMTLAGGNNITLSQNGNAVTIIGGAGGGGLGGIAVAGSTATNGTILFSNANNVTFGMNGSTITASAPSGGGGGGATFSNFQWPPGQWSTLASSISNAVMTIVPFALPQNLTATRAMAFVSLSGNTNSSGTYSISIALFTRNGSTLSLASSGSTYHAWASSNVSGGTAGSVFGIRRISVPINVNASPGDYYYGIWVRTSNNGLISIFHGAGANLAFHGNVGAATNSSRQLIPGLGIFSNASFITAMPSSVAISNVKGGIQSTTINRQPWILFTNFDLN